MLATGNSPGNDMRFMTEKVEASRNFANKLWNAARFIRMNLGEKALPLTLPGGSDHRGQMDSIKIQYPDQGHD